MLVGDIETTREDDTPTLLQISPTGQLLVLALS